VRNFLEWGVRVSAALLLLTVSLIAAAFVLFMAYVILRELGLVLWRFVRELASNVARVGRSGSGRYESDSPST